MDEDLAARTGRLDKLAGTAVDEGCDVEALLPLLLRRAEVGCVGPFAKGRGCVRLVGSSGSSMKFGTVDAVDAVEATEAE